MTERNVAYQVIWHDDKSYTIVITTTTGRTFERNGRDASAGAEAALQDLSLILAAQGLNLVEKKQISISTRAYHVSFTTT